MSSVDNHTRITIIGGEGIGLEVTAQSRRILEWFAAHRGLPISLRDAEYGVDPYLRTGEVMPDETWAAIEDSDAIVFGATGGPETTEVPAEAREKASLLKLRRKLDLYANMRPVFSDPSLYEAAPLKARVLEGVNLIIVRELTRGIYFGDPRGIVTLPDGRRHGFDTESYKTDEIERVARFSFELARQRRGKLCSVDKANVLASSQLWRETVIELHAREFPDVELRHLYVDNASMQLVRAPAQFDVLVMSNIFGDILSDCAAMASGSLGMLPSASLGPVGRNGRRKALYEPVHGSAPDIAGKGIANPLGSIQSLSLLFRMTLNRPKDAELLQDSIAAALAVGARTADLAEPGRKPISTAEMGDAVLDQLTARSDSVTYACA